MIGSIGILLAIALLIFLAFKGVNVLITGPLTAILIILFNKMNMAENFFSGSASYMGGLGNFLINYLLIFVLGAMLGKFLEDSGAALTIANRVLKLFGKDNQFMVIVSLVVIGAVLSYGGVNAFIVMFTMVALAKPLYEALDIPWHLIIIPISGGGTSFTMTMLPGTPAIQNAIPTTVLGTTLTAAPLLGIVASVISVVFILWYTKWQLAVSKARGEHFELAAGPRLASASTEERKLPSIGVSVTPMVVLIGTILIGSAMGVSNILLPALALGIVVCMILFRRYISDMKGTLNNGATNSIGSAVFTAAAVGVGTVVAISPGFIPIMGLLQSVPGGIYVEVGVMTSFMAAVTGSPSGALGIVMQNFGSDWLATGANPEAIHRLASIACGALGAMPHNGTIFGLMAITGLTHKKCYKHVFSLMCASGVLSLVVCTIIAVIMY